jgi:predicted  nucleic acid-binding Zn-ribbon protein
MSDLQLLSRLQELDLQLEAQTAALQEIESALGETEELTTARAQVDSLRELLHDQEQRLRELEWDADKITNQMRQDEQKLYGGKIHNPKELDGLRKDLEQQKSRRGAIDDRELQLMADIEVTQSDLQRARDELGLVHAAWEERQRSLAQRQIEANASLAALHASRNQQAAVVGPTNLSLYETLRREKRGRAVSRIERATCLGCRIALPMGVVQHVRAGRELVFCPSCGRVLYV